MIAGWTLMGLGGWFRKSLIAQIIARCVAFAGVWKLNNLSVEKRTVKKVVQASKVAGKKRNAQVRKIRAGIKPSDAKRRLLGDYAATR